MSRSRNYLSKARRYPVYGLTVLSCVLAVALCVAVVFGYRSDQKAELSRSHLRTSIQSDLTMVLRTYDQLYLPRADMKGTLLPDMREHLYSAYAMNNILTSVYGARESILDNGFYTQITGAIDTIERQIDMGSVVDVQSSDLSGCMVDIEEKLVSIFGESSLMPQTAMY